MTVQSIPGADATVQWFAANYPGERFDANCGVVHTTETTGWPGYENGATAPNATARPNFKQRRLDWRQHFPVDMSSRALRNLAGGVETNTLSAFQIELVGTCDPRHAKTWVERGLVLRAGEDYLFWPDAPAWALRDLAKKVAWLYRVHGIPLSSPRPGRWMAYPDSYGQDNPNRLRPAQWRDLHGWVGHQHVPENTHGDPGALDFDAVLQLARAALSPAEPAPPKLTGQTPTPVVAGPDEEDAMGTYQRYDAGDGRGEFVVTLRGAVHLKNRTHRDLLLQEGRVSKDVKKITKGQLDELLERE